MKSYAMVNGPRINHGKKNTIPHGPKLTHRRCYSMSEACLGSCPSRCFANEEDTCGCKWRAQETGQPTTTTAKWRFLGFFYYLHQGGSETTGECLSASKITQRSHLIILNKLSGDFKASGKLHRRGPMW